MSAKTVVIVVLVCATGAAVYLLRSHNTDSLVAADGPASIADVRDGEAERAFPAERTDPLWADAMEGQILGAIARTTDLQLVTLQVECRTSMCRLQLVERRFQDAEPRIVFPADSNGRRLSGGPVGVFADLVSSLDLDPRWVASVVDGNGTPTSLAYLARRDSVDSPRSR